MPDGTAVGDDVTPRLSRSNRPRRQRVRRIVLSLVAFLLLAGVGTAAGYVALLGLTVNRNVKHAVLLPPSTGDIRDQPPATAADAVNVLLVGSDPRATGERGRSDVMLLAHIPADRSRVDLVHFPRDLYVPIPGRPGRDKLNAAYSYGGTALLVTTMQRMLNMRIDHVAVIDMDGFRDTIDSLGGVRVQVDEASPGFPVGPMDLDGGQALRFVRERKHLPQGDISRGRREQAVMQALLERALSRDTVTNPVAFARFVDTATRHLTLDDTLTTRYLYDQALALRGLRGDDVVTHTAPYRGVGTTPAGASVVWSDDEGLRRLGFALREDRMTEYF